MTGKITSAYQQFSHQIQRKQQSQQSSPVRTNESQEPGQEAVRQSRSGQRTREQQAQLKQLRETGTLDNLRMILSEDEETVLSRIFPETNTSYTANAEKQSQRTNPGKGSLLDMKF